MPTTYYGISRGENAVTIDSSTTSKDVELAVDDTNSPDKLDVKLALTRIAEAVEHA